MKFEDSLTSDSKLMHEHEVYVAISGTPGIPALHWYRREDPYEVLILDRLGASLEEIPHWGTLNMDAVFSYSIQMVCVLLCHTLVVTDHIFIALLS